MVDGSWDNGGQGTPAKSGLPLWSKILLGCGIAVLVALVTCVGGLAFLSHKFKQDPEGAKRWALGFATDKIRPDWEDFSRVVDQLRTPAGCRALYAESPALAQTWPQESEFLAAAEAWRPRLAVVPPLGPELLGQGGVGISREFHGQVRVDWRPREGARVTATFQSARKQGDSSPRKLASLDVH